MVQQVYLTDETCPVLQNTQNPPLFNGPGSTNFSSLYRFFFGMTYLAEIASWPHWRLCHHFKIPRRHSYLSIKWVNVDVCVAQCKLFLNSWPCEAEVIFEGYQTTPNITRTYHCRVRIVRTAICNGRRKRNRGGWNAKVPADPEQDSSGKMLPPIGVTPSWR